MGETIRLAPIVRSRRRRHRTQLARGVRRLRSARDRHRHLRDPARGDHGAGGLATVPSLAVVYGVYDLTNYSTLRQWPFALTLVDVAWGAVASAAASVAVRIVAR